MLRVGAIAEQEGRINMRGPPRRGTVVNVMTMNQDDTIPLHRNDNRVFDPLVQVRSYWEGLREDDAIPLRSQISPRGIESALSSTFLIERIAPGIARFRIAGMDLADLMGMEVRGMPISAMFTSHARADLATNLELVFSARTILTLELIAFSGLGRPALTARLLVLPLRNDTGRNETGRNETGRNETGRDHMGLALGCIAISGSIGRSPRQFDIGRATVTKLNGPVAAHPAPATPKGFAPQVVAQTAPRAFAEAAASFDTARSNTSRPYLRLVK